MILRRLFSVVPLFVLAGCWPYLGGSFEDYVDGEGTDEPDPDSTDPDTEDPDTEDPDTEAPDTEDPDTEGTDRPGEGPLLAGWVEQATLLGDSGWNDPDLRTVRVVMAGLASNRTYSYTAGLPSSGNCVGTFSPGSGLVDALAPVGLSDVQITLSGSSFPLQAASDAPDAFVGGLDTSGVAAFNAAVSISGDVRSGGMSGTLTRTPSTFSVDEPFLDGPDIATLPFEPFDVEFSGTLQDAVVVSALYVDSNNELVGAQNCLGRNGSASLNPARVADSASDVAYVQLSVSRVRETSGSLSGSGGVETEVVGIYTQVGLFFLEDQPDR